MLLILETDGWILIYIPAGRRRLDEPEEPFRQESVHFHLRPLLERRAIEIHSLIEVLTGGLQEEIHTILAVVEVRAGSSSTVAVPAVIRAVQSDGPPTAGEWSNLIIRRGGSVEDTEGSNPFRIHLRRVADRFDPLAKSRLSLLQGILRQLSLNCDHAH